MESYSATVQNTTLLTLVAIAAYERRRFVVKVVDVVGAYLWVDRPPGAEDIHMILEPVVAREWVSLKPEFARDVERDGSLTVLLKKEIYGLKESALRFYQTISEYIRAAGWDQCHYDKCVFMKRNAKGQVVGYAAIYVDDGYLVGEPEVLAELQRALEKRFGALKEQEGGLLKHLGITHEQTSRGWRLSQAAAIDALEYREPAYPTDGACAASLVDPAPDGTPPARDVKAFRSTLASVAWIASRTRVDVLFVVYFLSTRQMAPTVMDEEHLARLVRFLKDTREYALVIEPTDMVIRASADASFGMHADQKGHTGLVITLGGAVIFAKSVKQKLVAKSSTEAELLALSDMASEVAYVRNLLEELEYPQQGPTIIEQDNLSAIQMANKAELGTRKTKHFQRAHYFVSQFLEKVGDGTQRLVYKPGDEIEANNLTKPIPGREWARRLLRMEDTPHGTTTSR